MRLHDKQKEIVSHPARFKTIRAGRKGGKALALDTPILTVDGFKNLIDVQVGDVIFNEKGEQTNVVYKSPIYSGRKCFAVEFSDHSVIIADAQHDWVVEDKSYRKNLTRSGNVVKKKKTTQQLADNISYLNNESNWSIPTCGELQLHSQQLAVEPYYLGLWLGDGTSANTGITTMDSEVVDYLRGYAVRLGLKLKSQKAGGKSKTYTITNRRGMGSNFFSLHEELRKIGVLNNKHIPDTYKLSSIKQRYEIIQGLMDSDGCGSQKQNEYCSISETLANDVSFLLNSLGIKNTVRRNESKLYGRFVGYRFRVMFVTGKKVFKLKRKDATQRKPATLRHTRRYITSVTEIDSVPVQCLGVDSPSHLFLAGISLITTHNTAMEVENICYKAMTKASNLRLSKTEFATGRKVIYIAPTQIQAREIVWAALKNRLHGIGSSNEQKLQMVVPNEDGTTSTIMVGGYENKENYRGLTDVVHITFDETDTFKGFFAAWSDIFRPLFLDTRGSANFIGTPKKENPNLRRLEKEFTDRKDAASFHFTSRDNPHISSLEIDDMEKEYEGNRSSYRQEVLAEHVDDTGALFNYSALVDVFSNTVDESTEKYLIVDVAGDGSDAIIFSYWKGLLEYKRTRYDRLNASSVKNEIRDKAKEERIPFSHILVDAVGVGEHLPHDPLLDGIIGYKSSFSAIKTDMDIVRLPNVHYNSTASLTTDYKNLRSQCVFTLADLVNNHKIASEVDGDRKEATLEELPCYQDESKGDGKRFATPKEKVKDVIGRSPDDSDCWIMRMYFVVTEKISPQNTEAQVERAAKTAQQFLQGGSFSDMNSAK